MMAVVEPPIPDGPCDFVTHPSELFGSLRWQGTYRDGLRDGAWLITLASTGAPRWETTWSRGRWHGPAGGWYRNGQLEYEGTHVEGRWEGLWVYWFETGQLAARGRYAADRKIGAWEYWDENGQPIEWPEWERRYMADYDFAWDDYTDAPHGENWPHPPGESAEDIKAPLIDSLDLPTVATPPGGAPAQGDTDAPAA
jgi:hypothetical protein